MALRVGETLGSYEIVATLGAGGMGEVYRARDPRVKRDVAIKTAHTAFTERFQQEAEAIAALSHPNVCTLFDVGPDFIVMELVDGETLAERLERGPLPVAEALRVARQIADALAAAHAKQIVHRDLKPGNVKIRPDGLVKVLDFGLAKVGMAVAGDPNASPTLAMGATEAGMILGTAGYMSPEQARGEAVDYRADVWAFGVLLYEMLSGARLYGGPTSSDTLAAVLLKEPDWSRVPVPELSSIGRLLRWCLEKDPKNRLSDIAMAKRLLVEDPVAAAATPPAAAGSRSWPWPSFAALLASVLVAGAAFALWPAPPPGQEATAFQLWPPPGAQFEGNVAVSADGRQIAIVVRLDNSNRTSLWLRSLDSLQPRMLVSPNEDQVQRPFWSPDGRWLVYATDGQLKKVPVGGGPPQSITPLEGVFRGGTWGSQDTIVFATSTDGGVLWRVGTTGGTPVRLTTQGDDSRNPAFLPDGKRFLFARGAAAPRLGGVFVGSLDEPFLQWPASPVLTADNEAVFVPGPDHGQPAGALLFPRDGALMAQPFDPVTLTVSGEPTQVVDRVGSAGLRSSAYAFSPAGTLVYRAGLDTPTRLTWTDRAGKTLGVVGESAAYSELDVSPDGTRLAAVRNGDLWIIDLERNTSVRLTATPAQERAPVWTTDGASIVFASDRSGHLDLYEKLADSAAPETVVLATPPNKIPTGFSPDGKWLLFTQEAGRFNDVQMLSRDTREVTVLLAGPAQEGQAVVSADGKWVAYASLESGEVETYLRSFPDGRNPRKVTEGQGAEPRWTRSGELFFRSAARGNTFNAVSVSAGGGLGQVRSLFASSVVGAGGFNRSPNYVPSPDGQRILGMTRSADEPDAPLIVIVNRRPPRP